MTDKHNVVYVHTGTLLHHKKEGGSDTATTGMNPEDVMLSERSQMQKDALSDSTHRRS